MKPDPTQTANVTVLAADGVRRALVVPGDIRGDIAFQNDINGIIAALDAAGADAGPWRALGALERPVPRKPLFVPFLRRHAA